jgi:hypothetical protein
MPVIIFRGTRAELSQLLHTIPGILAGRTPHAGDLARALQLRMGNAYLSQLQSDFITKSRGGTGRDGIKWAPPSPVTIAKRRQSAGDKQNYSRIYQKWLMILKAKGFPAEEARKKAAQTARKEQYQHLASRTVDIGRDTNRMFQSLVAGYDAVPPGSSDTTIRYTSGTLLIGSNVPYLQWFHGGTNRHPARPIAPPNGGIPDAWWPAVLDAGVRGLAQAVEELFRRG